MAQGSRTYVTLSRPLTPPLGTKLLPVAIDGANVLAAESPSFLVFLIRLLSPCPAIYLVMSYYGQHYKYRSLCRYLSAFPYVHIVQAPRYPTRRPTVPQGATSNQKQQQQDEHVNTFLLSFGLERRSLQGLQDGPPGLMKSLARWLKRNSIQAWNHSGDRQTLSMDDLLVIFCAKASNGVIISGDAFADVCRLDHSRKLAEFIVSRRLVARPAPPRRIHLFYPDRCGSLWDVVCSHIPILYWASYEQMQKFLESPAGAPPPFGVDEWLQQSTGERHLLTSPD